MDAIEAGLAHLRKMKQRAEEITQDLGLPSEDKYKVLSAVYNINSSLVGGLQNMQAQDASNQAHFKELVYQLSEGFLNERIQEQIPTFQVLWERLKQLPLEVLSEMGQRSAVSQGIGLTGGQRFQHLVSIISTISWAVLNQPTLSQTNPEHIQATIAKEAEARGCSRAESNALAEYMQTHAPYAS